LNTKYTLHFSQAIVNSFREKSDDENVATTKQFKPNNDRNILVWGTTIAAIEPKLKMPEEQTERTQLELRCPDCGRLMAGCVCTIDAIDANAENPAGIEFKTRQTGLAHPLEGLHYIGGKYKILSLIGRGGMGCVYKVKHEALDKVYALKILNRDVTTEIKTLRRFDQEAKAVGSMEHENLIAVHDYGTSDDGTPFLVMDYIDGISLSEEITRLGYIDEKRALGIFQKVADGLGHAHAQGVVHRDLKPGNIMLVKNVLGEEHPIVVDFGLAKRQTVDKDLTQTGDIFGTPLYMSPEQCMGNAVDARSDIYSLGCVMYESLSGKSPFEDVNAVKTIVKTPERRGRTVGCRMPAETVQRVGEADHAMPRERSKRSTADCNVTE
jgi:serine/threonine protein kinase